MSRRSESYILGFLLGFTVSAAVSDILLPAAFITVEIVVVVVGLMVAFGLVAARRGTSDPRL